jgi:amino acid permease
MACTRRAAGAADSRLARIVTVTTIAVTVVDTVNNEVRFLCVSSAEKKIYAFAMTRRKNAQTFFFCSSRLTQFFLFTAGNFPSSFFFFHCFVILFFLCYDTIESFEEDHADEAEHHHEQEHKSIGMLGSVSIAVNSLAGPAILQLPFQYQQSGIIPTTICLIIVGVLSSFCCLHMADTVSQVPGNKGFDKCIEFSDCFSIFWNKKAYVATQLLFFLCATCLNVAAIVDTAEVVDSFLGFHYKTVGWTASYGKWQSWSQTSAGCISHDDNPQEGGSATTTCGDVEPFGDEDVYGDYIISMGYLITAAVFVPICLMDLKENTAWQIFGFCLLCSLSLYFCIAFAGYHSLTLDNVTLWGFEWGEMLGVILFNFALVMAVPSWLHEKKDNVSVKKVVYGSTAIAMILYVSVGILGAFAIPHVKVNMLEPMVSGAYGKGLQLTGSLFAFVIIGLDIPLFSVLCRYNLVSREEQERRQKTTYYSRTAHHFISQQPLFALQDTQRIVQPFRGEYLGRVDPLAWFVAILSRGQNWQTAGMGRRLVDIDTGLCVATVHFAARLGE